MSDETPGAGHSALPPREGTAPKPAIRLAQTSTGQYVYTTQDPSMQTQQGLARVFNISPSRTTVPTSSLRPSLTNQSIVKAIQRTITKPGANVRQQLFQNAGDASQQGRAALKRSLPPTVPEKDSYSAKEERVLNHHNVKAKLYKEKYNEHLTELYYLESGKNLLDLYQFAKRPKTQHFINYLNENSIDPKESEDPVVPNAASLTSTSSSVSTSSNAAAATSAMPSSVSSSGAANMNLSSASTLTAPSSPAVDSKANALKTTKASTTAAAANAYNTPTTANNQEQIVEKAKQEAYVVQRINDLQKEGLWTEKRLPKIQEMPRSKAHWDFLLEEMVWLAADFAQERKWKKAAAKKCARMVQKYFQDKALAAQRAEKAHEQHIRRVAAFCAKEVKNFWSNVEKLVEFKQNTRLEEKRKKALDQHLSFIVDQTEKYSQLLAEGMNKPTVENSSNHESSRANSDDEFHPDSENSSDDEETIAMEEAHDQGEKSEEVAALQRESEMAFEDFLSELPKDYLQNRDKIRLSDDDSDSGSSGEASTSKSKKPKIDEEFTADSSGEDDEDTIQEQEKAEGVQDHKAEINDLNEEAEMDIEELRKKYANLPSPPADEDSVVSSTEKSASSEDDGSSEEDDVSGSSEDEMDVSITDDKDVGLKSLLDDSKEGDGGDSKTDNNDLINDAAAIAESIQPKGNTLSSTSVVTPVPFLLKLPLREYQHIGLDWLVTMFERKLNGILADEMGLGKTIQTIALLAHLACEKSNWGPHLIVVPTSVMLNWEMECKKWCPGFKILTYYGSQRERKLKRIGWTKPNAFHICITSYKLVIQDHQSFRRKKWKYLILDEAQNIKNFKSQRWQLLLNFQTQQRLLLTGTPLQNNLMELWSLMHFLMPHVFQSHREFKEWFSNPVTGMIEGNSEYNENIIKRLHKVLRPFLLRRLKCEVEKQMPKKYEHVVMCRLSKRQRFLYEDYMSRAKTKETLASGNLLSVINVLMQLRKVCNHPNLFEPRPTISPFHCEGILQHIPALVYTALCYDVWKHVDLTSLNLNFLHLESHLDAYKCYRVRQSKVTRKLIEEISSTDFEVPPSCPPSRLSLKVHKNLPKGQRTEIKEEKGALQSNKVKLVHSNVKGVQIASTSTSNNSSQSNVNLTSVLKQPVSGFAQLVQTSTGKHILLTPTSNITTQQLGITGTTTVMTSSGQRLTVLSKQPVPTTSNSTSQPTPAIAKAVVKVQLTSLPNSSSVSQNSQNETSEETVAQLPTARKPVNTRFIEKLYLQSSKNKNLDVRWQNFNRDFDENAIKTEGDEDEEDWRKYKLDLLARLNNIRCNAVPIYGTDLVETVTKFYGSGSGGAWTDGILACSDAQNGRKSDSTTDCLRNLIFSPQERIDQLKDIFERFLIYVPSVQAPQPSLQIWNPDPSLYWGESRDRRTLAQSLREPTTPLHHIASAMMTQFPHPRLIQYDCGKLQTLDRLLRKLKIGGHRVLIFTQMTKMLDVLEAFLNYHGHIYLRLDGSTKIDQRQILMERFNGDTRIFAFILSTRSGGVGVNLTGADTVIFYDSDWNPTMDAQAQDRCHRIGQTRDVHIYRLVSEMTIEENILKKANQKRLLGDLAIEGGNFTTAYFKSSTIQELFNINSSELSAATRMSEMVEISKEREKLHDEVGNGSGTTDEKAAVGVLENALAECEDDQDVLAARTAKAEAVADLAEFDETIPLEEQDKEKEPEVSKAEMEVENLVKQLTPVERYAMRFIEETEAAWSQEQLAAAEREIEEKKREWEENRLASMREEEERRARELEEESEMLTFSREDATNQIWVSANTNEQMPMWCPPTPPQQDGDVYVDQAMSFLYNTGVMDETMLPPVYVKKESKRSRHEAGLVDPRRPIKIHRKDDTAYPPKSLFERPPMAALKMRRDIREIIKASRRSKPTGPLSIRFASSKPQVEPPLLHAWTIHEDMAILKVIQNYQGLNLNLFSCTAHTPNWDFVSDYVNTVSITYRSPKQCRSRFDNFLVPREEGKQDTSPRKKKQKGVMYSKYPMQTKSNRPMRTAQMYMQDNNNAFSQVMIQRYETLKALGAKKTGLTKPTSVGLASKYTKHDVLLEAGIDFEHPISAVEIAAKRAERMAKEKKAMTPEQVAAQRLHLLQRGFTAQNPNVSAGNSVSSAVQQAPSAQVSVGSVVPITSINTTVISTTPPNTLRMSRIVASPLQNQNIVAVTGISPAQLQAATQRLIVSSTGGQSKATVVSAGTVAGKAISPAQLQMIRQATLKQQHLRLQSGALTAQTAKATTVTIAGQTAVQVQFSQGQPRAQYVKQGTVTTVGGKQQITRTLNEAEMAQILKRQQLQHKVLQASQASSLQNQVFAQTIQAGSSNSPVATIVKAVSSAGVTQTVIGTPVKALPQGLKGQSPQQLRTLQIQQQLLAQKKLVNPAKIAGIAHVAGKGGVATQLILGSKPPAMTLQQFQQVIRSPLPQNPVVLTKPGGPRVIPVQTGQGNKPTIQVVTASSQGLTTSLRQPSSSNLSPGTALIGNIKVHNVAGNSAQQHAILSQVSAALQGQNVRQGSPVRIQTSSGGQVVAAAAMAVQQQQQQQQQQQSAVNAAAVAANQVQMQLQQNDKSDHVSRLVKKQ